MKMTYRIGKFFHFLRSDQEVEQKLAEHAYERQKLNIRLENVTRATLNGESDWFRKIILKDPSCALRVIKECDTNDH